MEGGGFGLFLEEMQRALSASQSEDQIRGIVTGMWQRLDHSQKAVYQNRSKETDEQKPAESDQNVAENGRRSSKRLGGKRAQEREAKRKSESPESDDARLKEPEDEKAATDDMFSIAFGTIPDDANESENFKKVKTDEITEDTGKLTVKQSLPERLKDRCYLPECANKLLENGEKEIRHFCSSACNVIFIQQAFKAHFVKKTNV